MLFLLLLLLHLKLWRKSLAVISIAMYVWKRENLLARWSDFKCILSINTIPSIDFDCFGLLCFYFFCYNCNVKWRTYVWDDAHLNWSFENVDISSDAKAETNFSSSFSQTLIKFSRNRFSFCLFFVPFNGRM